jgi:hypothetical protein
MNAAMLPFSPAGNAGGLAAGSFGVATIKRPQEPSAGGAFVAHALPACSVHTLQEPSTLVPILKHLWGRLAGLPSGSGRLVIGPSSWSGRPLRPRFPVQETLPKGSSYARVNVLRLAREFCATGVVVHAMGKLLGTEPLALASGRWPRAKVTSDWLSLRSCEVFELAGETACATGITAVFLKRWGRRFRLPCPLAANFSQLLTLALPGRVSREHPRRQTSSFIERETFPAPVARALAGDRVEKPTAGLGGIGGPDKKRPTEPRASASGRQPRAKVMSDSLTLAVPCSSGIRFFMGFRGPKAYSNRPGGLSHIASTAEKPPCRISALQRVSRACKPCTQQRVGHIRRDTVSR